MSENKMSVDKMSFVFGLVLGVAIISVGALLYLNSNSNNNGEVAGEVAGEKVAQEGNQPSAPSKPAIVPVPAIKDSEYIKGNKNASLEIIEYSDFECPFCYRHKLVVDKIYQKYKDRVKIVFRHFPLSFHPNAQKAAEASECAGEQGKFWEMYDKLFQANADKTMGIDQYKNDAAKMGLDMNKFNTCLDDGKYASKVVKDRSDGAAAGAEGTPATFFNGQLVSGALLFEQFEQIIDSL